MKSIKKRSQNSSQKEASSFSQKSSNSPNLNKTYWFWGTIILYVIFSLFTFDLHISEGGDDSTYIIRALMLLKKGSFPSYQGPLYPLVLSLFIATFGLSLSLLKISSWIFLTASLWFLFKAFKGRVSSLALKGTFFLLVVNHHFLYFGSQTYSEAFFMMLQGIFFLLLFGHIKNRPHFFGWKNDLILALLIFAMTLTRTVGLAALPALLAYLFYVKQPKDALKVTIFFSLFTLLFLLIKYFQWGLLPLSGGQAISLLSKHPYDPSQGQETLLGFLSRFAKNSNLYLSKHFLIMIGIKPVSSLSKSTIISLCLYFLFFTGMIRFSKKNPFLLFTGIYLMFFLGATFLSLQTLWDQSRLIMPYFPLMLLFLFEITISITTLSNKKALKKVPLYFLIACFILSLAQTLRQTDFSAIGKQLAGDRYYGYTQDWKNYLKMAHYVSKELPEESYVACRKPNMACLYGSEKRFYGIYRTTSDDADTLLTRLNKSGVTHILVASLRKNPRQNSGAVINTIHRYVNIIAKKYPGTFHLQKRIGTSEPAWLFKINYNAQKRATSNETPSHEKQSH